MPAAGSVVGLGVVLVTWGLWVRVVFGCGWGGGHSGVAWVLWGGWVGFGVVVGCVGGVFGVVLGVWGVGLRFGVGACNVF